MYETYYGLAERPFDLSPNPRFLFLSAKHREALAHLQYGLTGRSGVTVVIGEAGTGKTTLVKAALQSSNVSNSRIVHLSNPTLTRSEFYEHLADGFGFSAEAAESKSRFLYELELAIVSRAKENSVIALVVDEAQSLPHELLEEIRLLTNIEAGGRSLALTLVGQPELSARLNEVRLRQLKQRVALRCELEALDLRETASYISARIRTAGGRPELLFTREAILAIHDYSKGIPRTISVLCDNALLNGLGAGAKPVGVDLVLEVCRDFHLADNPVRIAQTVTAPNDPTPEMPESVVSSPKSDVAAPAGPRPSMFGGLVPRRSSS
jgi:general secretion pathway protein A